jgi:hypothetical protein
MSVVITGGFVLLAEEMSGAANAKTETQIIARAIIRPLVERDYNQRRWFGNAELFTGCITAPALRNPATLFPH